MTSPLWRPSIGLCRGDAGSLGLLPSASYGLSGSTLFLEPVHGAASDIAGRDRANPIAAILCVAMMLEYVCLRQDLAAIVIQAVEGSLASSICTPDIGGNDTSRGLVDSIVERIKKLRSKES